MAQKTKTFTVTLQNGFNTNEKKTVSENKPFAWFTLSEDHKKTRIVSYQEIRNGVKFYIYHEGSVNLSIAIDKPNTGHGTDVISVDEDVPGGNSSNVILQLFKTPVGVDETTVAITYEKT